MWDVSSMQDMTGMFNGNIWTWDVPGVRDMTGMFNGNI
jgi:hypothetical protein